MRRQKRDRLDRAYSNGYQAGLSGKNREHCPYQGNNNAKSEWLGGWREAMTDRSMGLYK
ncbi:ribosome modulation factor [Thalassotalea fusca]